MSNMEQLEQAGGNTKSPANPSKKSRIWAFTFNNPMEPSKKGPIDMEQMERLLHSLNPIAYIFQLEEGESKTPHYQGCVKVKNPIHMPKIEPRIHWEQARNWDNCVLYCQKPEGRLAEPRAYNVIIKPSLKIITDLRPWQKQVKELIDEEPDDRKIMWFWESKGNSGKTAMAKYILHHYKNALFVGGKGADCKYAAMQFIEKNGWINIVIFGLPRSTEEYVSYTAIEELKDGLFFSPKYESGGCLGNSPHVIIFANFPPDTSKLSADRWYVECIDDMEQ